MKANHKNSPIVRWKHERWIQLLVVLLTAVCMLSCECLQQLVFNSWYAISVYFGWLSSFVTSFFTSVTYTSLDSSSRLGNFRQSNLPSVILSTSLFRSNQTLSKKVFTRWLLTLFKSAKENEKNRDALRTHFTQAYWWLDTLPTIINSWYYELLIA